MTTTGGVDSNLLNALRWRNIGPPRGGRTVAVAGDPVDPTTFYFGACAGGIWKTSDGGIYWQNISDGFLKTAAVGAIAVSEADPNVIYAGMGEACIRGNVSHGDGVYRSTDTGKTWTHLGLEETRHISRVRVHPRDPDTVYVAALGHAYGHNKERGVFRSTDGGQTWEQVLFRSDHAGAVDLSLDPTNPRVLYASFWDVLRTPWGLTSGGPDSSIYKSTDGGDNWTEITRNPGLPEGTLGRIGVAASPAKAGRVWATVEAENPGLFRSEDGGDTWEVVSDNADLQGRPWYYQHVFADPQDADTVWILNYLVWKSIDGGRTFTQVTTPHGDNHDLWIDPKNPKRMIEGNDGGACISFNGGDSWSSIYNQPTAQFYHVRADTRFPYRVYGTQQDNSAISVPSRTSKGAIPWGDCYTVGSAESGHIAVHPDDPDIVFAGAVGSSPGGGGNLLRYDHRTGQVRIVTAWPELAWGWGPKDQKYRFQWTFPILFSPHDSSVLYITGNQVFRSTDQGSSWDVISPDLTRNDPSKLGPSGGPVTRDTTNAETYCTIFAFVESPHEQGVFWAGSDDGLVHISRDGGETWDNVTPSDLPEWATVSTIEASPHDPATAYLAAHRYRLDDFRPLLFVTNDYGATWRDISGGIRENDFTRVIREDPGRRGLLYVGTETGLYVSFDDGETWQSFQANLPVVPVYDLFVKDDDLLAATHGRSFWILDDLSQVRQIGPEIADKAFHLAKPRRTFRLPSPFGSRKASSGKNYQLSLGGIVTYTERKGAHNEVVRTFLDSGENPPDGVVTTYYIKEPPKEMATLTYLDAQGNVIKTFSSVAPEGEKPEEADLRAPAGAGMNRFLWNMRYPDARRIPQDKSLEGAGVGPLAVPGTYQVVLTVDGQASPPETFEIVKDPRVAASQEDLQAQFDLLMRVRDRLSEANDAVVELRSVRQQVDEWESRARGGPSAQAVEEAATGLKEKLGAVEDDLIQVGFRGARDRLHLPVKLNRKLAELLTVVGSADFAPARQMVEVFHDVSEKIDNPLGRLQEVMDVDVPQFINLVHEVEVPAIVPRSGRERGSG